MPGARQQVAPANQGPYCICACARGFSIFRVTAVERSGERCSRWLQSHRVLVLVRVVRRAEFESATSPVGGARSDPAELPTRIHCAK